MSNFGKLKREDMAMVQNQWYHFWVGAAPIFVYFSGWIGMFTGVRFGF